jgi:hypothetical protein
VSVLPVPCPPHPSPPSALRIKREKAENAAEQKRLHDEIVVGLRMLTEHIAAVQSRLTGGVSQLAAKVQDLRGTSSPV